MRSLSIPKQIIGFIGWLLITFCAAATGAMASVRASTFYQQLTLPDWAPPASVFGPVWTVLYLMMAVSVWLVWRERSVRRQPSVFILFLTQLGLNALWTWLFFGWKLGGAATLEIIVLWVLILANIMAFWKIKPLAGVLLLPYLAWVSFATALCYSVWKLNPQQL